MSSSPQSNPQQARYYPTEVDLSTPKKARAVLQQVLKQHYELADSHTVLKQQNTDLAAQVATLQRIPPPGGPTNTQILGLPVIPIDTSSLANGATLKWDRASGSFKFS